MSCRRVSSCTFQFTHPVRGATTSPLESVVDGYVSIHAPRAGCDIQHNQALQKRRGFNSRTPCGVRQRITLTGGYGRQFQFTHPVRGATYPSSRASTSRICFNSRTPCGVRRTTFLAKAFGREFQFTHPVRGATHAVALVAVEGEVSIHAPRAGCDILRSWCQRYGAKVSIHAPRAGCDAVIGYWTLNGIVSIHAPRAGCDHSARCSAEHSLLFQFTHPVRGATRLLILHSNLGVGFNSRTPCGVRRRECLASAGCLGVSIHAPRAGCDIRADISTIEEQRFQFTHPVRGATSKRTARRGSRRCFNSRTPCGVRHVVSVSDAVIDFVSIHAPRAGCDGRNAGVTESALPFQFTHPVRGATPIEPGIERLFSVSIHAPRAGCDLSTSETVICLISFQFTHPVRGATLNFWHLSRDITVSIHAPRAGCDY